MKILIAPWGNPWGWKKIKYFYKDGEPKESKSSLELVREKEEPDKTIIVVLDTLCDDFIPAFKNPSYKDLKNSSENLIINFCKNNFNFEPDKVIVSYGFGEFNNTKFIGNAVDFYYNTFKELAFYFTSLLQQINKKIEVIFDATHGINWTTILTYRALREILEILAYVYDVKLKVLNSDPYIGREAKIDRLNINIIEESKILPKISVYRSDKRPVEPCFLLENKRKEEIGRNIESFISGISFNADEILIFLGSFYFALPVFILSYMINPSELKDDKIEEISKKFEENIDLNNLSKLEISRNWEFRENFANLVKAYLVSSILEKLGFGKLTDIPLSKIEELKNKVFGKLSVESNRIDKEIDDVKNLQNLSNQYQVYNVIKSGSIRNQIDKRNFFAHAGFEYNTIELKKENEEIYVRIYDNYRRQAEAYITDDLPKI